MDAFVYHPHESLMDFMVSYGGVKTIIDPCLPVFYSEEQREGFCGLMAIHVDDICHARTKEWKDRFIPCWGECSSALLLKFIGTPSRVEYPVPMQTSCDGGFMTNTTFVVLFARVGVRHRLPILCMP